MPCTNNYSICNIRSLSFIFLELIRLNYEALLKIKWNKKKTYQDFVKGKCDKSTLFLFFANFIRFKLFFEEIEKKNIMSAMQTST